MYAAMCLGKMQPVYAHPAFIVIRNSLVFIPICQVNKEWFAIHTSHHMPFNVCMHAGSDGDVSVSPTSTYSYMYVSLNHYHSQGHIL